MKPDQGRIKRDRFPRVVGETALHAFPHCKARYERVNARPTVERAREIGKAINFTMNVDIEIALNKQGRSSRASSSRYWPNNLASRGAAAVSTNSSADLPKAISGIA